MKQKEAFQEILNSKNKLIKRFEEDLEKKDEDYVKMLNNQKRDINEILEKMREQFNQLRKVYLLELTDIENEFLRDVVQWPFCLCVENPHALRP
jgi:sugar-specific transcriptional regulator TrmB